MPARPLVSVVIPTRDRAALLGDALASAAAQGWRPLEIVVVDDGSVDDTAGVVDRAAARSDVPIRLLAQDRRGGNAARNLGAAEARADYLAFLDSDDLWHDEKLARQMAALAADPGAVAVYCGVREVEAATGRVLTDAARAYPAGDLLDALLVRDVTAPTSTWLVRRAAFEAAGGFDVTLAARQDWDLWIRLAGLGRIAAVPAALVDLRHHDGPRTASDPTRELMAYRAIRAKYAGLRKGRGARVRLAAAASFHRRSGRVHLHYRRARGAALAHYLAAVAIWPFDLDSYAALAGWFLPRGPRAGLHRLWNRAFGGTRLAIRSH